MPRFVKKPVVVEATQWFPGIEIEGVVKRFDPSAVRYNTTNGVMSLINDGWSWGVETLEGFMKVSPGDWIITGVENERYPCKASIFEATYEEI